MNSNHWITRVDKISEESTLEHLNECEWALFSTTFTKMYEDKRTSRCDRKVLTVLWFSSSRSPIQPLSPRGQLIWKEESRIGVFMRFPLCLILELLVLHVRTSMKDIKTNIVSLCEWSRKPQNQQRVIISITPNPTASLIFATLLPACIVVRSVAFCAVWQTLTHNSVHQKPCNRTSGNFETRNKGNPALIQSIE